MKCEHNIEFTYDGTFPYSRNCKEVDLQATRLEGRKEKVFISSDTVTRATVTRGDYQNIHHANKVYKRLQCIESTQLSISAINDSERKLSNDYSLE